jgi:formylglycine-generating enzyme required for sulfatase activity
MLQKAPEDRYQSATDVLADLDSIDWHSKGNQGSLVSSPIPSARLSTKWFATLCAIAGFIVLGFLLTRTPRVTKVMTQIPEGPASIRVIPSEPPPPIPTIDHPWIHELRIPFASDVAKEYQQRWADALGLAVESENRFGIRFVLIPPGEFLMGYSLEDFARLTESHDNPAELEMMQASSKPTWVRITFPFYISKYEITEAERARVLGTDHSLPSVLDLEHTNVRPRGNSEEYPVTRIPWEEAQLMCQTMNEKSKLETWEGPVTQDQLARGIYRLPTEAEWEWASRSGRIGVSIADPGELDQEVWMLGNTPSGVQMRGLKKPNPFGLHDTLGNAQEWCLDNFDIDYFAGNSSSDPLVNPLAITKHPHFKKGHVLRGGAIIFGDRITNFTFKTQRDQYSSSWFTGLRVVRPIPPEAIARLLEYRK